MSDPRPWTPRPYQIESLRWVLERPHCGLMLDPGLGKTSTTLAAVQLLGQEEHVHHVLVVAPLRVAKTVWPVEAQKWADFNMMEVVDLTEKSQEERVALLQRGAHIFVINPESLQRVLELDPWKWVNLDMLVIDESTKFKDSQTQRFKALKKYLHKFNRRVILTGTPAPNGLQDLFGQMYVCDRGESLGQYITHFRQRYMYKGYDGFTWHMAPGSEQEIYERVKPKLLRLMAKDHLEMPELINNPIEVILDQDVMRKYRSMEDHFLLKLSEDTTVVAFNSAALGTKCRQIANGFVYDGNHTAIRIHDKKLDALEDLIESLQGRPLIVCYEFIEDSEAIRKRFPQAVDVSKARDISKTIRDFNAGDIPLLIGHPKSMGHGLNLQEKCHDICWFGITWDLELYQQAIARVWRQGQPSQFVINHQIVAKDTLDLTVVERLNQKDVTQNRLNEALKIIASQYVRPRVE